MEEKLKLLQEMATTEGDIRDGNIGSFSQGVVVGERNASKLALEIIESIKRGDKEPYLEKGLSKGKLKTLPWKPITRFSCG